MASLDYLKYVVIVKELKFDSIRQETYWVTVKAKEYRTLKHAKAFASRFGVDVKYFNSTK